VRHKSGNSDDKIDSETVTRVYTVRYNQVSAPRFNYDSGTYNFNLVTEPGWNNTFNYILPNIFSFKSANTEIVSDNKAVIGGFLITLSIDKITSHILVING